jgi:hypothetical protein
MHPTFCPFSTAREMPGMALNFASLANGLGLQEIELLRIPLIVLPGIM